MAQQLALPQRALGRAAPCSARQAHQRSVKRALLARADPESRVVREYREDDDSVVVPGAAKRDDGALYVDDQRVRAAAAARKDNMSKEMKERLRKEYVGFGGAENQVPAVVALGRTPLVVAAVQLAEPEVEQQQEQQQQAAAAAEGAAGSAVEQPQPQQQLRAAGGSKWVIDENELLTSTWEHRAWTYGSGGLMLAAMAEAAARAHSGWDAAVVAGAFLAAYVLSDLGTGVYHWGVDNYGDGNTPVFGRQIAAFQGHHQRPWTITQREFANNVHQVFKPAAPVAAAAALAAPFAPLAVAAFVPSFLLLICMSQQFHAWSHMKKSELPGAVVALQDAGLLIGRKAHGAHHKPNFDANYCIVSGWWNDPLDGAGFFRWLEKVVHAATGVEPRCWYPPEHDWAEQAQP